jgi:hypothetical protein
MSLERIINIGLVTLGIRSPNPRELRLEALLIRVVRAKIDLQ